MTEEKKAKTEKVQAILAPMCINGSIVFEEGKLTTEELGKKLAEITKSKEFLEALDKFVIELNRLFGEATGLDRYVITFIPAIYPITDKEYTELVKDFTETVLSRASEQLNN